MKSLLKKLVNIMKPKKPLSRQRIWQKKMQEQGRCVCCGEQHERKTQLCDKCAARDGAIYRHADRAAAWAKVDWTRPTKDIAKEFGVTPANVCYRRKQFGIQSPGRGRPRKQKPTS